MQCKVTRQARYTHGKNLKLTPRSEKLQSRINTTELPDINTISFLLTNTIQYNDQRVCWSTTHMRRHTCQTRGVCQDTCQVSDIITIHIMRIILVLLVMFMSDGCVCDKSWHNVCHVSCITCDTGERGDSLGSTWNKQLHVSTYSFSFVSDLVDSFPFYTTAQLTT